LAQLSDVELVNLQLQKNDWYVRKARRLLQERAAAGRDLREAHAGLFKIFNEQIDITRKLRAMWALADSGGAKEPWLLMQLRHPNEHVRVWAIRFLGDNGAFSVDALRALVEMAQTDGSSFVRLALASALQRLQPSQRIELATALLRHAEDAADH